MFFASLGATNPVPSFPDLQTASFIIFLYVSKHIEEENNWSGHSLQPA